MEQHHFLLFRKKVFCIVLVKHQICILDFATLEPNRYTWPLHIPNYRFFISFFILQKYTIVSKFTKTNQQMSSPTAGTVAHGGCRGNRRAL
jgi:hypothetical protein